jgi:hypothetical protein
MQRRTAHGGDDEALSVAAAVAFTVVDTAEAVAGGAAVVGGTAVVGRGTTELEADCVPLATTDGVCAALGVCVCWAEPVAIAAAEAEAVCLIVAVVPATLTMQSAPNGTSQSDCPS